MEIAEALTLRAEAQREVHQLRARITADAHRQEGTEPTEDAAELLAEAEGALDEMEVWTTRINRIEPPSTWVPTAR